MSKWNNLLAIAFLLLSVSNVSSQQKVEIGGVVIGRNAISTNIYIYASMVSDEEIKAVNTIESTEEKKKLVRMLEEKLRLQGGLIKSALAFIRKPDVPAD